MLEEWGFRLSLVQSSLARDGIELDNISPQSGEMEAIYDHLYLEKDINGFFCSPFKVNSVKFSNST